MATKVHFSHAGIMALLNSPEVGRVVNAAAEAVYQKVRAHEDWDGMVSGIPGDEVMPVSVKAFTSDRARAEVFLAHPAGLAVQAKHGVLTRAAAELGLEVNG